MSAFSGKEEKGAARKHKEGKREEAEKRHRSFSADVERIMSEQNIDRGEAVKVAASSRRFIRRKAEKLRAKGAEA